MEQQIPWPKERGLRNETVTKVQMFLFSIIDNEKKGTGLTFTQLREMAGIGRSFKEEFLPKDIKKLSKSDITHDVAYDVALKYYLCNQDRNNKAKEKREQQSAPEPTNEMQPIENPADLATPKQAFIDMTTAGMEQGAKDKCEQLLGFDRLGWNNAAKRVDELIAQLDAKKKELDGIVHELCDELGIK